MSDRRCRLVDVEGRGLWGFGSTDVEGLRPAAEVEDRVRSGGATLIPLFWSLTSAGLIIKVSNGNG